MKKILFFCFLISSSIYGQLGFCTGSKGDPILNENFGAGDSFGPQLATGITNYTYKPGKPTDGEYTIHHQNLWWDWHANEDHTPGDTFGKLLIVNAAYSAGEFYTRKVSGLCEKTTYQFSSWLINISSNVDKASCSGNPHNPVNVTFQILDTSGVVLATGDTGNIPAKGSPEWEQYGLIFTTTSETEVILKMINNGTGGCGNDLGIDDILFSTCGDLTSISSNLSGTDDYNICEDNGPLDITLTANVDVAVYDTPVYLWQESTDDGATWNNTSPMESSNTYNATGIVKDHYYRVRVAENSIDLNKVECSSMSKPYKVSVVEIPLAPTNPVSRTYCEGDTVLPLSIDVQPNYSANWYDAPTGGVLLENNSTTFTPTKTGTYYVETTHPLIACRSTSRTPVDFVLNEKPKVIDEDLKFCQGQPLTITAGVDNATYLWSTSENTKDIVINTPGTYTVTATSPGNCAATKTITTSHYEVPIIKSITSNGLDIIVLTEGEGDFEYSLDNAIYQVSNIFEKTRGGKYTIYVRNKSGCNIVSQQLIHLEVPNFFTPNGDMINDTLIFYGLKSYPSSTVSIFDRYGKLLAFDSGDTFSWDGTHDGTPLPSADYWYKITLDDANELKGHFSLKR